MTAIKRVFVIVVDSFGIGAEPDAADFGDSGSHTLKRIIASPKFHAPTLTELGLFNIDGVGCGEPAPKPLAAFARLRELSQGKDTTTGHWELAGLVSSPLPSYPEGFPPDVVRDLEAAFGKKILCNKPYSGTEVIRDFGREHEETGCPIVYTSVDSVLQIAAHEKVVPVEKLYEWCRKARGIMQGERGVGRIIARPFLGDYPDYERTPRRHDFSLPPTGETMLDALAAKGLATIGIGKIADIFAGRGIGENLGGNVNDMDGMDKADKVQGRDFTGLCFVNLVDCDMRYGHRRDVHGYAQAITDFDRRLKNFMDGMRSEDLLFVTADHGCDPGFTGTDHTREYVPLLIYGDAVKAGSNLGTYPTFAMLGATVADVFDAPLATKGESLLPRILR